MCVRACDVVRECSVCGIYMCVVDTEKNERMILQKKPKRRKILFSNPILPSFLPSFIRSFLPSFPTAHFDLAFVGGDFF